MDRNELAGRQDAVRDAIDTLRIFALRDDGVSRAGQQAALSIVVEALTATKDAPALDLARVAVSEQLSRYLDGHRPGRESRALAAWLAKGFA